MGPAKNGPSVGAAEAGEDWVSGEPDTKRTVLICQEGCPTQDNTPGHAKAGSWEGILTLSWTDVECGRCRLFRKVRRPAQDIGSVRRQRPMTPRCLR